MKTIELNEAAAQLPQLVEDVTGGETFEIMMQGRAVARLVAPPDNDGQRIRSVIEHWREFREREGIVLGDNTSIRDLIDAGRRY